MHSTLYTKEGASYNNYEQLLDSMYTVYVYMYTVVVQIYSTVNGKSS